MEHTIFVWGNAVWNLGLVAVCASGVLWFFRKWMKDREEAEKQIKKEALAAAAGVATSSQDALERISNSVLERIDTNRQIYLRTYDDLNAKMDTLSTYQKEANGNMATLAKDQAVQKQRCDDRVLANVNCNIPIGK